MYLVQASQANINKSKVVEDKDKVIMVKTNNDAKDAMEKDSLCRYYDDFKSITSKILDIFKSIDDLQLKKILDITSTEKPFIYEMDVERFIAEFKSTLDIDKIRKKANPNMLKKYEIKIFDSYLEYLVNIFKDELSLTEYNLEAIFKSYIKLLNSYLKDIRKAVTVESTKEMGKNLVKKNFHI